MTSPIQSADSTVNLARSIAPELVKVGYWAYNLLAQGASDDTLTRIAATSERTSQATALIEFKRHLRDAHLVAGMPGVEYLLGHLNHEMQQLGSRVEIELGMRTRAIPGDPSLSPGGYGELTVKHPDHEGAETAFWF